MPPKKDEAVIPMPEGQGFYARSDKDLQQNFNLPTDQGVLIVSTTENGAAAKAGLKQGGYYCTD